MHKPLVVANWKMHGSLSGSRLFAERLNEDLADGCEADIVICPPYVYLSTLSQHPTVLDDRVSLGAQNLSHHEKGAFSGEISAAMLCDLGCRYVIVGHSERRMYYGESDTLVAKKCRQAKQSGLTPIVCVGESGKEREAGDTEMVIKRQLEAVIDNIGIASLYEAVIAYEPVWAIGKAAAELSEIAEVHDFIRSVCSHHDKEGTKRLKILYGGSVNSDNIAAITALSDVDGALVGGASLQPQTFMHVCRLAAGG